MSYQDFEGLKVWQRSRELAVRVYRLLENCRDYGLKDQMCRSAVSVASNIAEGAERNSEKEFVRFLRIAKGSAGELRTQVYIAMDIGVLSPDVSRELVRELKEITKMLGCLIQSKRNDL